MTNARTAERLVRILAMLPWVIAHPGARVEDICARFGYPSSKDLVADLNLVFVCGLPGYGPGDLIDASFEDDEVYIDMADYFSKPMRLTKTEALVMLAAGMAVLSTDAAPAALGSAVEKLSRALLPDDTGLDIDLGEDTSLNRLLGEAARDHRVVRLRYTALASGETTHRDVEPWTVFTTMGNWYLSAFCRRAGGARVFRIDRIQEATPTGETFSPPQTIPPATVGYSPGADDPVVHLALAPQASWVADYYPVEELGRDGDRRLVVFAASDLAVIARLMLRLGDTAQIVGGPQADDARAATDDLRRRVLDRYR